MYDHILHIEKTDHRFLPFIAPSYEIYTTDSKFSLHAYTWKNSKEVVANLSRMMVDMDNIYVKNAFYKNSIANSLRTILSSTQGKIGFSLILIYLVMALIGGLAYLIDPPGYQKPTSWILWSPYYLVFVLPDYPDVGILDPPNADFWFGTDYSGRDIFSRMIFGTTITMGIAIVIAFIVTLLILSLGLSSAIYGGAWDSFITRLSDVLLTFPTVVWIILISVFSTPFRIGIPGGFYLAVYLGMSLVMWPLGARLVRSEVLEGLDAEYVQAIDLAGGSRYWIIRKHVFPKVIPTIFLLFFYQLSDIVIGISLLGYLGFGSESTLVWGSDLAKSFLSENIQDEWWTVVFPSLFIFGIVLGLTLFSDALRDSYASKYRGGIQSTLHSSLGGDS